MMDERPLGIPEGAGKVWHSMYQLDHVLVGRVWDVAAQEFITPETLRERAVGADFVLLGEKHDNIDHHQLQAWFVNQEVGNGRYRAFAMEMLASNQVQQLEDYLTAYPFDSLGLGAAVGWERSGWPDWFTYQPVVEAALKARVPVLAASFSRNTIRSIVKEGYRVLPVEQVMALGLNKPIPMNLDQIMEQVIRDSHLGALSEHLVKAMVHMQIAKDARMASVLINNSATPGIDGALLIAGGGHIRKDIGVPWHIGRLAPGRKVLALAMLEVQKEYVNPTDYLEAFPGADAIPYDYVWFTPRKNPGDDHKDNIEIIRKAVKERSESENFQ